jgi:uncharacterized protein
MPTAAVTGATAGLGAEFARQLAATGYDLVLVARNVEALNAAQQALSQRYGVDVEVLPADLTTDEGCRAVGERVADAQRPVELLINNAGTAVHKVFGSGSLDDEERQLDLNVRAVLRLSHAAVRAMSGRNSGRIINVSSVAGFVPRGSNATYSASKAWVTMLSEAAAVQLHGTKVTVTAICPGFTRTGSNEREKADEGHVPKRMLLSAEDVVRKGLADAMRGKPVSVPGRQYRSLLFLVRVLPRPLLRGVLARRAF